LVIFTEVPETLVSEGILLFVTAGTIAARRRPP
jgi:hypothetical protein